MDKKYKLTDITIEHFGVKFHRIFALIDIPMHGVCKGDLGGFVQSESNLSHEGSAWVSGDAKVIENAEVFGNAKVSGNATVYGNAMVYGNAEVYGNAKVYGNAQVSGNAMVYGNAEVSENAKVYVNAMVYGNAEVFGDAWVSGNAKVNNLQRVIFLSGLQYKITLTKQCIAIGCKTFTFKELKAIKKKQAVEMGLDAKNFTRYKKLIMQMYKELK